MYWSSLCINNSSIFFVWPTKSITRPVLRSDYFDSFNKVGYLALPITQLSNPFLMAPVANFFTFRLQTTARTSTQTVRPSPTYKLLDVNRKWCLTSARKHYHQSTSPTVEYKIHFLGLRADDSIGIPSK